MSENIENQELAETPLGEQAIQINPQELYPKDVATFIRGMMLLLSEQAWIYMGMIFHPIEGRLLKDLLQAQLAINSLEALLDTMSNHLEEREEEEFRKLLADLKLNFVTQSNQPV